MTSTFYIIDTIKITLRKVYTRIIQTKDKLTQGACPPTILGKVGLIPPSPTCDVVLNFFMRDETIQF